MSGLETAIRNALDRSDRANAESRARVYQSARQALETGLRKQNIEDPEAINHQRRRLEALIHAIELEERARLDVIVDPPAVPSSGLAAASSGPRNGSDDQRPGDMANPAPLNPPVAAERPGGRVEPAFGAEPVEPAAPSPDREPAFDEDVRAPQPQLRDAHSADEGPMPDMRSERALTPSRRRRGGVARLMIWTIILATLGIGAWWVYTSGLLLTAAERDTSVPNPPPRAEEEDFSGTAPAAPAPAATSETSRGPRAIDTRGGFSDDWVSVFEPDQISALHPRANSLVDMVTASDGTAARIVSRSGDAAGAIEITVPTEVLRELAGRTSTIALTLQSADDNPVQISVECDFPRMGNCPRHRFTVNPQKLDALFRVTFDNGMAPSTPGRLLLNADLSGEGRGLNLYAVRVLPGQ